MASNYSSPWADSTSEGTSMWRERVTGVWAEPEPTFADDYATLSESLEKMKEKMRWNKPEIVLL